MITAIDVASYAAIAAAMNQKGHSGQYVRFSNDRKNQLPKSYRDKRKRRNKIGLVSRKMNRQGGLK